MAVAVKEQQVVISAVVLITVAVMHFQHIAIHKAQATVWAFAFLLFQQGGFSLRIHGGFAQSCAPIQPVSIERAFCALYLRMSLDLRGGILDQASLPIREKAAFA